jgi:hypothetical protein
LRQLMIIAVREEMAADVSRILVEGTAVSVPV